jgi:hypothetical protein
MQTIKQYCLQPNFGAFSEVTDFGHWLIAPCGANRDMDALQESNWRTQLALCGGESDSVQIFRFGHWACGWVEILAFDPEDCVAITAAEEIERRLGDYPVLDENDFSELESEQLSQMWADFGANDCVRALLGQACDKLPLTAAYLQSHPWELFEIHNELSCGGDSPDSGFHFDWAECADRVVIAQVVRDVRKIVARNAQFDARLAESVVMDPC